MKELSIFVDESGDWGEYDFHSPYYIISMVMHDQIFDITENLILLEKRFTDIGYPDHTIHAGPIIRSENVFFTTERILKKNYLKPIEAKMI